MISVGIDVSKGKSTVCILKPGGEVIKPPFDMVHAVENLDFWFLLSIRLMRKPVLS